MFKVDSPENGKRTPQRPAAGRCRHPYATPKIKKLGAPRATHGKEATSIGESGPTYAPS